LFIVISSALSISSVFVSSIVFGNLNIFIYDNIKLNTKYFILMITHLYVIDKR
jgi:hypothetical protein